MEQSVARKKFIESLSQLMNEKNLTKALLSRATKIPETTVGSWFIHERTPNLYNLHTLADFFNCTIDYLTGREN